MAITTIEATDQLSDSRTDINDNFTDLDTTKADLASPTFTGTVSGTFSGNLTGDVTGNADTVTGYTPASGSLTLAGADALTITTTATTGVTLPTTGTLATLAETETFTNKRITSRVGTVADGATITPVGDSNDLYTVTALGQTATIAAPSGTPTNGQKLILRIKDDGTSRALTWNAIYNVVGVALPTATTLGKTHYVGCMYNTANSKWDVLAVGEEA